jgi:RNA-directed DNA polymerase
VYARMLARWKKKHRDVFECLSDWFDLHPDELNQAAIHAESGKTVQRFQSKSGRDLQVPEGTLYTVQSRFYQVFLRLAPIATAAHGGVPGRSILSHAGAHLPRAQNILSMDIRRAYDNVKAYKISQALRQLLKVPCRELLIDAELRTLIADYLTLICTVDGHLPLGAVTSPALFNLIAVPLDKSLERVCCEIGTDLRYSRYLDDLVISSPTVLPRNLAAKVKRLITTHDLGTAHPHKTHLLEQRNGDELSITGITHDGTGFGLSRNKLSELETALKLSTGNDNPNLSRAQGIYNFIRTIYGPKRIPRSVESLAERHLGVKR